MSKIKNVIEGLTILAKYDPAGNKAKVEAYNNKLYACPDLSKNAVSEEDIAKLEELGWDWSMHGCCWRILT